VKLGLFVRSLMFEVGRGVLTLVFATLAQVLWLASYQTRYAFLQYWTRSTLAWLRWTCGLSYRVHGLEHVDPTRPSLIMMHHESAWETLAAQLIFPRQSYVLKKELLKIPFFGWTLAMLKPIAIDRSAGRQAIKQLLLQGQQRLIEQRDWVVIFPEGTRVPTGTIGKINKGGAMLAKKTNVPVYLVTHNAGRFWPKNSFLRSPGVIDVYVRPALDPQNLTLDEINELTYAWFQTHSVAKPSEGVA
jgi:1-acyl-sn-glycerol-3-phosphate acyltransferase